MLFVTGVAGIALSILSFLVETKIFCAFNVCHTSRLLSEQEAPPLVIDLTGGQPDITPEWVPWMMEALIDRGLSNHVYLWSDDNLSNDFFWKYLTEEQIKASIIILW